MVLAMSNKKLKELNLVSHFDLFKKLAPTVETSQATLDSMEDNNGKSNDKNRSC